MNFLSYLEHYYHHIAISLLGYMSLHATHDRNILLHKAVQGVIKSGHICLCVHLAFDKQQLINTIIDLNSV